MNIRLRALLLKIVILSSRDIISHNEVALQHMIWYARYLFKFWYKVLWDNKKWLKYWTDGHFGHWTLKFLCFVLLGHYGCPRGFKLKSFFVEGFLRPEFMKLVYSIKYMSQMCHLEFDVTFTMLFITPLSLSREDKLTVTKTLPSRFTEKSTSLNPALLKCLSAWRMVSKKHN